MLLSLTFLLPLAAATLILLLPAGWRRAVRGVSLLTSVTTLALVVRALLTYDRQALGLQFTERHRWIPMIGADWYLGADGMNLPLLLLAASVYVAAVLIAWNIEDRPKAFYALLHVLVAGVFGVFVSLDLFCLFVFYELAILPMYLLIGMWGSVRKEYGAMKLTLYILVGSALVLLGMLATYHASGLQTFDIPALAEAEYSRAFQTAVFPLFFFGFGVLAGIWPFHTWSPVGYAAAPTSASMLHAGVLHKLGAYGCLRVAVGCFPDGALVWLPAIAALATVNIVYNALAAFVQTDLKYVIGYSSVSHMGFVLLGIATLNSTGVTGAVLQMFAHGIMTALLFATVGRMVYDRTHTRDLRELGGLAQVLPFAHGAFWIGGLASMGLPGLAGFVAELHVLIGAWHVYPLLALAALIGVLVTAAYVLRMLHSMFYGELNARFAALAPITLQEKVAGGLLMGLLLLVGLVPAVLVPLIQSAVDPFLESLFAPITWQFLGGLID